MKAEENTITTELAKQNVTEMVIADLKKKYLPLKINGIDDKEGYKAVHDARIVCRDHRTLTEKICKKGREDAVKIQKEWIAKEKEVVAQISEVEQHLKKQEDAIDAEKEAIAIRAERLLKLPGRKEQMIGLEKYLGPLSDEDVMRHDDTQWQQIMYVAQNAKLRDQQKIIDDANAKKLLERTILRENELIATGATLYSDGLGKVYRKGITSVSEQAIKECPDEGWPKIVEVFINAKLPEAPADVKKYPASPAEATLSPRISPTERTDEEKLFYFAGVIENLTRPVMTTKEGKSTLALAEDLLSQAINLLRQ
jgi:hypothetical protein